MAFTASTYANFVAAASPAQERLFLQYIGPRNDFDVVIVGSGIGGGVLADDLAERIGEHAPHPRARGRLVPLPDPRLQLRAGSRTRALARHFGCDTFWQGGNSGHRALHRREAAAELRRALDLLVRPDPDRAGLGARLLPRRGCGQDLEAGLLDRAGETMNESRSMGATARRRSSRGCGRATLAERLLHPGDPARAAPALPGRRRDARRTSSSPSPPACSTPPSCSINQVGLTPGVEPRRRARAAPAAQPLRRGRPGPRRPARARRPQHADRRSPHVPRAAPSCSPAGRSRARSCCAARSMFPWLPGTGEGPGRPRADRPSDVERDHRRSSPASATSRSRRSAHAKIVFYSRGRRDGATRSAIPFNVEMNINHEYWHLRDNDPDDATARRRPVDGHRCRRGSTSSSASATASTTTTRSSRPRRSATSRRSRSAT